jgi:ABC-type transport system substrate-binding protein
VRLNKQGKPIVLRLEATTDQPGCQIEAKLITGWLQQLGLTIKLSVVDSGALESDMYNAHGSIWAPNFDLIVWEWTGYFDPGQTLNALTTREIGNLNDPYWSNAQYDKLAVAQDSAVNLQQRQTIIWQMQQIMYQQTPWIPTNYPDNLEAVNTAKWTGWTQLWGTGPAWNCEGNVSSYLNLRSVTAATTTSSSSSTTLIAVVVVVVIVAAAVAYVSIRRRRGRRVEDEV